MHLFHPRDLGRRLPAGILAILLVLVAACGTDDTAGRPTAQANDQADVAGERTGPEEEADFPVTIENCGIEQTFDGPPDRAITMNQHVTEIMLALGLESSMVGTAFLDSDVRRDLVEAFESVPLLADEYPSREQVLAAEPDIVIGGYSSAFGDEAAGSREGLADIDVASYLTTGYCPDFAAAQDLSFVIEDIIEIGSIFGVPEAADELIAEIESSIDSTTAEVVGLEPVEVFVYDSGTDQAFTAAGFENTTSLIELAGGRNVFDDVDDSFTEVSWEEVVARDPDTVLILDYGSETVDEKQAFLRQHPVASTLRAVAENRFVVAELTDVVPGIRNGDAVASLAAGLHPEAVGG